MSSFNLLVPRTMLGRIDQFLSCPSRKLTASRTPDPVSRLSKIHHTRVLISNLIGIRRREYEQVKRTLCDERRAFASFPHQRCGQGRLASTRVYKFFKMSGNHFLTTPRNVTRGTLISNKIIHLSNAVHSLEPFQSYMKLIQKIRENTGYVFIRAYRPQCVTMNIK